MTVQKRYLKTEELTEEDREKRRASKRRYYDRNKETLIPKMIEYNKKPETKNQRSARNKRNRRDNWPKAQINGLRHRAKQLGVPFNLTVDDLIVPDNCPVLGFPLAVGDGRLQYNSPSVDRVKPHLGYVSGNVNVISYRANTIKLNATIEEVAAVLQYMKDTR